MIKFSIEHSNERLKDSRYVFELKKKKKDVLSITAIVIEKKSYLFKLGYSVVFE